MQYKSNQTAGDPPGGGPLQAVDAVHGGLPDRQGGEQDRGTYGRLTRHWSHIRIDNLSCTRKTTPARLPQHALRPLDRHAVRSRLRFPLRFHHSRWHIQRTTKLILHRPTPTQKQPPPPQQSTATPSSTSSRATTPSKGSSSSAASRCPNPHNPRHHHNHPPTAQAQAQARTIATTSKKTTKTMTASWVGARSGDGCRASACPRAWRGGTRTGWWCGISGRRYVRT